MPTFRGRQRIYPKQPRVRLDLEAGAALQLKVLQCDGWRCQTCGSLINLQVHHKNLRTLNGPYVTGYPTRADFLFHFALAEVSMLNLHALVPKVRTPPSDVIEVVEDWSRRNWARDCRTFDLGHFVDSRLAAGGDF